PHSRNGGVGARKYGKRGTALCLRGVRAGVSEGPAQSRRADRLCRGGRGCGGFSEQPARRLYQWGEHPCGRRIGADHDLSRPRPAAPKSRHSPGISLLERGGTGLRNESSSRRRLVFLFDRALTSAVSRGLFIYFAAVEKDGKCLPGRLFRKPLSLSHLGGLCP